MERDIMGDEDMPYSIMWNHHEEIVQYHFQYRSFLEKLLTSIHSVMIKYSSRHPYNSITSMVRFYESYKIQKRDLMDYYNSIHKPSIEMDSQCCIGRALYLRRKHIKYLSSEYPDLEKYMFLVTSSFYSITEIPARHELGPPEETVFIKDHAVSVIKFTLEDNKRRGYVIMDTGFMLDFPVVVMEDRLPPHTGKFTYISYQGDKIYEFLYYNEFYVYWKTLNPPNTKEQTESEIHRWFYVGKKLKNVRQIEKRNQLYPFHALVFAEIGGPSASIYTVLGGKDHIVVGRQITDVDEHETKKSFVQCKIPFSYFLTNEAPRNQEWDEALEVLNKKYPYGDGFHDLLKRFVTLASDNDFVSELSAVNKEWAEQLEQSLAP